MCDAESNEPIYDVTASSIYSDETAANTSCLDRELGNEFKNSLYLYEIYTEDTAQT